jgi:hypothetical protein
VGLVCCPMCFVVTFLRRQLADGALDVDSDADDADDAANDDAEDDDDAFEEYNKSRQKLIALHDMVSQRILQQQQQHCASSSVAPASCPSAQAALASDAEVSGAEDPAPAGPTPAPDRIPPSRPHRRNHHKQGGPYNPTPPRSSSSSSPAAATGRRTGKATTGTRSRVTLQSARSAAKSTAKAEVSRNRKTGGQARVQRAAADDDDDNDDDDASGNGDGADDTRAESRSCALCDSIQQRHRTIRAHYLIRSNAVHLLASRTSCCTRTVGRRVEAPAAFAGNSMTTPTWQEWCGWCKEGLFVHKFKMNLP